MTTSNWNVSASGDWSDASDWSGGVPNSSSDDAVIAQSGTYTVTIGSGESFTVGSITLNDANATLKIGGKLDLANTLTLTAGTLNLTGTIDGGTIDTAGGTLNADGGTLAATTVQGTINLFTSSSDPLVVSGGLDMAGIGGTGAGTINFSQAYSDLQFSGTETITNATFAMNTNVATIFDYGAGTVTIAATTAFNQSAANTSVGIVGTGSDTGTVVNDGTINASAGGDSSFAIGVDTFTNAGTISVTNGDTLQIFASNLDNTGTISVDGTSTLQFGAVTTGELGTIDTVSGSTLYFSGTLDNADATYVPAAGVILAGTIEGGTIQGTISVSTVNPLTLSGDPTMEGAGGSGQATINLTQTFGHSSVLSLSGTVDNTVIDSNGGQIVSTNTGTLGPSTTVDVGSSGTIVGDNDNGYLGLLVNDGSIDVASGGPLMIESLGFTNAGSITISNNGWVEVGTFSTQTAFTNTGTISIDGTSRLGFDVVVTTAQIGTIDAASGAAISFAELMNVGATLAIPQGVTVSGEIDGGTIEGTLIGGISLLGNIQFEGAGGVGAGTINETGYQDSLDLYGPMTINNVVIDVGYAAGNGTAIDADGNATVTFGPSTTISQAGSGTDASLGPEPNLATAPGYGTFVSNGTIDAAATNNSEFFINVDSFTNNGVIDVTNGETLIDSSPDFVNTGTISVGAGSTLVFQETISTGELGTLTAVAGATLEIFDLNNVGETFIIPAGVTLEGTNGGATIDGGTIEGSFSLTAQNASITLEGNVAMLGAGGSGPGAINDTGNNSALDISGFGTLSNATISLGNLSDADPSSINLEGGALAYTVTVNQTGAGNYAEIVGPGTLAGVINAESDGGILSLIVPTSGTLTNFGSISVSGGDTLDVGLSTNGYQIETTFSNTGTISVDGSSTLNFDTTLTAAELGTIIAAPGAVIDFMQSLDNVGATFVIPNGVVLEGTIDGGTIEGTLNLNGAVKVFTLEGGPAFTGAGGSGAGTINLNASTDCTLYLSGDQTVSNVTVNIGSAGANNYGSITLENADTITLSSTVSIDQTAPDTLASLGSFGVSGTFVVDGTITAASNGGTFVLDQGNLTNNGTISVSNGDTLLDQDTNFTNNGSIAESSDSLIVIDPTSFTNYGTIAQTGSKAAGYLGEDTNISATEAGTLANYGTIDAASSGGALALDPGTLSNEGVVEASNGSLLLVGGVNAFTNMSETGELTGGTYEAGAGSTIEFGTFENLIIDDATLIVSGPGSVLEDLNLSTATSNTPTLLTDILEGVDTRGVLEILGGQNWASSITFDNEGVIELGGGTFSAPSLDNSGTLSGYGTFAAPISDGGAYGFIASGGTLSFGSSLTNVSGPTLGSDITLGAEANSTLQLPSGLLFTGTNGTIIFGGPGAVIESLNGSNEVSLMSTLENISAGASLEILGGDNFTSSNAIVNDGTIQLEGGEFSSAKLTNASGATLEGYGTISSVVDDSGTVTSSGGVFEFTATGNVFAGPINGPFEFDGGTDSFESGATGAFITITGGAVITLGTSLSAGLELGAGSIDLDGNTLTLGDATIAGSISGPGTLTSSGGDQTISSGAYLGMTQWDSSDYDYITIAGNVSYGGSFTQGDGATLLISSGNTLSVSGSVSISSVIDGAGTLLITGGTTAFTGFADPATSNWTISGGAVSIVNTPGYVGLFDQESGTSLSIVDTNSALTLNGVGSDVGGSVSGAGTLAFAGSDQTISSGAIFTVSNFQVAATGVVDLEENLAYGGAFTVAKGGTLAIFSGDALTLSGTSSIAGTLSGGGTLTLSGGSATVETGASLAVADLAQSSGTVALDENLTYSGALTQTGGTLALGANTLMLSGTGSTVAGTISGTGTLALKGGSQTIGSGAVLSISSISVTSGDIVTIAANTAYAGSLSVTAGTTITVDSGDTLTLSGTTTLQGTIGGAGTLSLGGGTLFVDSGAAISTNELAIGGTATLGLKESLSFAGVVSEATGTSISIGPGSTLTLTGTGSTLDGTVTGKGTLLLDGGTDTLKGTTMQVSDWTLAAGAVATFGTDINYAGVLTEDAGTTLALGSKALNLSGGSSDFAGAITGTAALNLKGGSQEFDAGAAISIAHWNLTGKDSIAVDEDLTYAGAFSSGNGTKIAISAGETLDLTGAATISSKVSGAGQLELTGGTDVLGKGAALTVDTLEIADSASVSIDALVKDIGALSIDATSSLSVDSHKSFDLAGAATGAGTFVIDANATLEFSSTAASTLTANFDGTDALLKLADLSGFAATISGFAVGDTIDLMHHSANSAVLEAGDELVIKHNSTVVATFQLSGDYTGYTFETSSDDHGGTDITLIAPPESSGLHIVANIFSPDWHLG
jgi:fibronectin-binding autotransporter adhesin